LTDTQVNLELIKELAQPSPTKIVLMVLDGLGGLPDPLTGKTELETAETPNLDGVASQGICGQTLTVGNGITPGSAPGHLGLFGYNPITYRIGRGVLETVGIDFDIQKGDVATRGNFCTVDDKGLITDRRAGRISTEKCAELCRMLDGQVIDGVSISVAPVKEHRFVAVFRGDGLSDQASDSDPQQTGVLPLPVKALSTESEKLALIANKFTEESKNILLSEKPANMFLLRGFSMLPNFPSMSEVYKLKPAAISLYPMYRGLAKLVGMEIIKTGTTIEDEFKYDFFFMHVKATDSAGEDGDFSRKVSVLEEVDSVLPRLLKLAPDVIVVSGDHSTPALLKGHSWHPIPILLYSKWCRTDGVKSFSESACISGGLGNIPATDIMPLAMANALKLNKLGA